jgi:1-acyl-sn-glycerol-3-phosphate acyltransferase
MLIFWRLQFWLHQGQLMQQSGHLTPPPSIFARLFWRVATPLLVYLCIGPVTVIGRENLRVQGKRILVPNHTHAMDFALVSKALRGHCRYMVTTSEVHGLRGAFAAWTGAIPVNTHFPQGGELALNASIQTLVDGDTETFLIFPQGRLLGQDQLNPADFKHGFARIARSVYEETDGEPAFVIPMALYYKRDASQAPWSHWLLARLRGAFGQTNYGAVVVVGEAIATEQLPADPDAATAVVVGRLQQLLAQATMVGAPATDHVSSRARQSS